MSAFLIIIFILFMSVILWPLRQHVIWQVGAGLACALLSFGLYWQLGDYNGYHALETKAKHQAEIAKAQDLLQQPELVIERMRAHLEKHPKSPKGWFLLGRLYASRGDNELATQAYRRALAFGEDVEVIYHLIQALYVQHGVQTTEISGLVKQLRHLEPHYLPLDLFLANDAYQHGDYTLAIKHWRVVLAALPPNSADHDAVLKLIAKAQRQ